VQFSFLGKLSRDIELAQYEERMKQINHKVNLPPDDSGTSSTAGSAPNGTGRTTETTERWPVER
jgi:hypothetical protein